MKNIFSLASVHFSQISEIISKSESAVTDKKGVEENLLNIQKKALLEAVDSSISYEEAWIKLFESKKVRCWPVPLFSAEIQRSEIVLYFLTDWYNLFPFKDSDSVKIKDESGDVIFLNKWFKYYRECLIEYKEEVKESCTQLILALFIQILGIIGMLFMWKLSVKMYGAITFCVSAFIALMLTLASLYGMKYQRYDVISKLEDAKKRSKYSS